MCLTFEKQKPGQKRFNTNLFNETNRMIGVRIVISASCALKRVLETVFELQGPVKVVRERGEQKIMK